MDRTVHLMDRQAFKTPEDLAVDIFLNMTTGRVKKKSVYGLWRFTVPILTSDMTDQVGSILMLCMARLLALDRLSGFKELTIA